ncbi:MAG TPA: aldehyde dehydrogenase family protein [Thermoanaerobaculia bacterium]|jgi:acyl-CoA reductase-like NAD-dependent aldehyde dehydrogenase/nicotinamidase-related amidase
MRPLLLLVDLQNDFLAAPGLEPAVAEIVGGASRLLSGARARGLPIVHVITAIDASGDDRMPHWKALGRWRCVRGTPGHSAPPDLAPRDGEAVVEKKFFSAFGAPALDRALGAAGADTLVLAGVHLHGCVRATALDAYQRGFAVWVAEDAVGSDDPLHAAVTRRYLEGRAARFAAVEAILNAIDGGASPVAASVLPAAVVAGASVPAPAESWPVHRSPRDGRILFAIPAADADAVDGAARAAAAARPAWERVRPPDRRLPLERLAKCLESASSSLARQMAVDVGKPVAEAEAEVRRAAELLRSAPAPPAAEARWQRRGAETFWRRVPLGVVAIVSPWNNPVGIPLGKIGPALSLGNAVVWKPAPAASRIALEILAAASSAGIPEGLVNVVCGGGGTARALMESEHVDAVSLSGSSAAGWAAQEICARRRIPLQAELGGNNAAIVWEGADVAASAAAVARGAFGFAGQRCTANRRAVVQDRIFDRFAEALAAATAALRWGDPLDPATDVGPLLSVAARDRVAAAVARAEGETERIVTPHAGLPPDAAGAYLPPTIVVGPGPASEIVQTETFGPVLVLQRARDFDEALELAGGVRQGLVAALFGGREHAARFLERTRAGVLKRDRTTAGADASAPFGGWKFSGLGPPERGPGDVEFYTRIQALYGDPTPEGA